jgi:hypothetical protein
MISRLLLLPVRPFVWQRVPARLARCLLDQDDLMQGMVGFAVTASTEAVAARFAV